VLSASCARLAVRSSCIRRSILVTDSLVKSRNSPTVGAGGGMINRVSIDIQIALTNHPIIAYDVAVAAADDDTAAETHTNSLEYQ